MASPKSLAAPIDEFGRSIARLLGKEKRASNVPGMLAARRQIIDQQIAPEGGRLIGRNDQTRDVVDRIAQKIENDTHYLMPSGREESRAMNAALRVDDSAAMLKDMVDSGGSRGVYQGLMHVPGDHNAGVLGVAAYRKGDSKVRKHEVMHGMNHAASLGYPGMPYMSRLVASNPLGLGRYLDELSATATGGVSELAKKTATWPLYSMQYAREGDYASAAAALASGVLPPAAVGTAAGLIAPAFYPLGKEQAEERPAKRPGVIGAALMP